MAELTGKVTERPIETEVRESYLTYAMSVIVSRALPDARDGLKPVHRRILYAMEDMGLQANRPYRKTARLVGDVLGKYHPHGDAALYEAMVRLAQDFSMRYPVVDGQGNFGSVDGDPPAAMRYTEARLAPVSEAMLRDIGKDTVDFVPNYDDSLTEPAVLPAAFPYLLANGASGIAVGMATNIPPHNLAEVARATLALIDDAKLTDRDLMKFVMGPDFPTGGIIFGRKGIESAYTTGKGKIVVRARAAMESLSNGREAIIVSEIPYQVNKANLIVRIADLVKERRLDGIADLRDESDRRGMRIVIEIKRGTDSRVVLNRLFTLTQLQDSFHVNALALVGGKPQVMTLRDMLVEFIQHRRKVVVRRARFDLKKAEQRAHILEGLKIALDNIDEVVRIIRASRTVESARNGLRERFELSVAQAQAILDMRLQRLTSLETRKVEEELAQVRELIAELRTLLASQEKILAVVKKETAEVAKRYGDDRRTEIVHTEVGEFNYEDLIEEEDMVVVISNRGIIKRIPSSSYRRQMRGGKGAGSRLRGTDFISQIFIGSTHDYVLFITSAGRGYWLKVHELPERTRQSVGQDIRALLQMEDDEEVTAVVSLSKFSREEYLFMATSRGVVKKVRTSEFSNAKRRGVVAINLDLDPEANGDGPGDHLVSAMLTDGKRDVVLIAATGKALRFKESGVRPMGRATRGMRGMRLREGDQVVGAVTNDAHRRIFIISERGFGKRMDFDELNPHSRGTMGQFCYREQEKNGPVVDMIGTYPDDDLVCITSQGQVVKLPQQNVPVKGKNAALGVKIVRLRDGDSVVGVARVAKEE